MKFRRIVVPLLVAITLITGVMALMPEKAQAQETCQIQHRIPIEQYPERIVVGLQATGSPGPGWRVTKSGPFEVVAEGTLDGDGIIEATLDLDWDVNYSLQIQTDANNWFSSPGCQFRYQKVLPYCNIIGQDVVSVGDQGYESYLRFTGVPGPGWQLVNSTLEVVASGQLQLETETTAHLQNLNWGETYTLQVEDVSEWYSGCGGFRFDEPTPPADPCGESSVQGAQDYLFGQVTKLALSMEPGTVVTVTNSSGQQIGCQQINDSYVLPFLGLQDVNGEVPYAEGPLTFYVDGERFPAYPPLNREDVTGMTFVQLAKHYPQCEGFLAVTSPEPHFTGLPVEVKVNMTPQVTETVGVVGYVSWTDNFNITGDLQWSREITPGGTANAEFVVTPLVDGFHHLVYAENFVVGDQQALCGYWVDVKATKPITRINLPFVGR